MAVTLLDISRMTCSEYECILNKSESKHFKYPTKNVSQNRLGCLSSTTNTVWIRLLSIGQKKLVRPILNIHQGNFFSVITTPDKRRHI
jgi:hypothetical protein